MNFYLSKLISIKWINNLIGIGDDNARHSRKDGHVVSVGLRRELELRVHLDSANLELVRRQRLAVRVQHVVAQGDGDLTGTSPAEKRGSGWYRDGQNRHRASG